MPLSIWLGLEDCLQAIIERRPRSLLDAGIGFGLWGHLFRQYLDVWCGRIRPEQWAIRIDGIEIDPQRVQEHARHLYSNIYIGDIRDMVPRCASEHAYEVIFFGDVIGHLPRGDGLSLLHTATELATAMVVVRVPLGDGWRKEGREPPDHHRSQWSLADFNGYRATLHQYDYFGNPYALVIIKTGAPAMPRLDSIEQRLGQIEGRLLKLVETARPSESG